jgi:YbbR domain-containing protein
MNSQTNRKKTGLKIISVIMSVLLWAYVVNQGGAASGQNQTLVALDYRNVPPGLTAKGPEQVTIKLWGIIEKNTKIKAYVDLSGLEAGEADVPVLVEPGSGAILTRPQPRTVHITLTGQQEHVFPIAHQITHNPPSDFELLDISVSPDKCLVRGEPAILSKIDRIVAEVDLRQATDIFSQLVNLSACDVNGKPVGGSFELIPRQASIYAVVAPRQAALELPVTVVTGGILPPGFQVTNLSTQPASVKVMGKSSAVDNLTVVPTEMIDLTGKRQSFQQEVELRPPHGVSVFPARVIVNVTIGTRSEEQQ